MKSKPQDNSLVSKGDNPFIPFASSQEEIVIFTQIYDSVLISNVNIKDGSGSDLLNVITEWRAFLGLSNKTNGLKEELALIYGFIVENYQNITIGEVRLAYKLSITQKLREVEFRGLFSAEYVSKVLESYLYYRRTKTADAIRRKELYEQEQRELNNKPSPEQQAKNTIELFKDFYEQFKETGQIVDPFNICYNFLVKRRFISDGCYTTEAVEYGKKMATAAISKMNEDKPFTSYAGENGSYKIEVERYSKIYCVQEYFKKINIDVLCKKIKPILFLLPEDRAMAYKQMLSALYQQYKDTKLVEDEDNDCYEFLRAHRDKFHFVVTQETLAKALAYGKEKNIDMANYYARNFCVQNYFKDVDIVVLLNNVTPDLFS